MFNRKTKSVAAIVTLGVVLFASAGCFNTRKVDRVDAPGYGQVPGTGLEFFCDAEHGNLIYFSDPSGSDVEYEWIVWGGCDPNSKTPAGVTLPDNEG